MPDDHGGEPAAAPAATSVEPLAGSDADAATPDAAASDAAAADAVAAQLASLSALIDGIPELLGPEDGDLGSNSWVVSGALTESGLPLLANDPHLGPAMPSIWAQMGLHCAELRDDCGFDVSRLHASPGFPASIIGHNERIAWGFTNLGPDVADLYVERVDGDTYELDGAAVPLTAPRGDDRGGRRRPGHDHGALHGPRPARHRRRRRLRRRRGGLPRGIRPARGRLRRLAAVDGADARHAPRRRSSR